jgi:glutamate racemase
MIGVFDSGHAGLTVFSALVRRFPRVPFVYLGDHRHVPYGSRPSDEIVTLTRDGVDVLFRRGCRLVLLGCNTATCVAARTLQKDWLPVSGWVGRNILGIVAPTVEAATQTPWAAASPQNQQKCNVDTIAVFGATRTITSHAYPEEIRKRCPNVTVAQQTCAELITAIERGTPERELNALVAQNVTALLAQTAGMPPHGAILGCTHFALVESLFRACLPVRTRLVSQPDAVADSLEDYLNRHPHYVSEGAGTASAPQLLTTGEPPRVNQVARMFWPDTPPFTHLAT